MKRSTEAIAAVAAGEKLEDWTRKALLKAAMLAIANRDRRHERI